MADPKSTLDSLIEEHGGVLIRKRKHKVYRFPNGTTFVVASTPECPLAYDNALAHLKRILGIYPPNPRYTTKQTTQTTTGCNAAVSDSTS